MSFQGQTSQPVCVGAFFVHMQINNSIKENKWRKGSAEVSETFFRCLK